MRFPVAVLMGCGLAMGLIAAPPLRQDFLLLRAEAARGVAEAQFLVGLQYQEGHGVRRDLKEAVKWLRQAAEAGHASAQFALGELLATAPSKEQLADEGEGERWLKAAAAQGNVAAVARLNGQRPDSGQSVSPYDSLVTATSEDPAETMRWRLLLSGLRGADALLVRGFLLENGIYVSRDLALAAESYRKAAELGAALGQYRLGLMYAQGRGVERNEQEACAWFILAEAGGLAEAKADLAILRNRLSAEQVAEADRRARVLAATLEKK